MALNIGLLSSQKDLDQLTLVQVRALLVATDDGAKDAALDRVRSDLNKDGEDSDKDEAILKMSRPMIERNALNDSTVKMALGNAYVTQAKKASQIAPGQPDALSATVNMPAGLTFAHAQALLGNDAAAVAAAMVAYDETARLLGFANASEAQAARANGLTDQNIWEIRDNLHTTARDALNASTDFVVTFNKIELPALRKALIEYALAHPGFKPTEEAIFKLNKAVAVLPARFNANELDQKIHAAFGAIPDCPPANYFGGSVQPRAALFGEIRSERQRLHALHDISEPLLRQVLFNFGATQAGANFCPTTDDVKQLNAALANLPANANKANIDKCIQAQNSFVAGTGTAVDFIQNDPQGDAILAELQRLAVIKAKVNELTPSSAAAHPELIKLVSVLSKEKQEELLKDDGIQLKKFLTATTPHAMKAAARAAELTNESFKNAGFGLGDNPLDRLLKEQQAHDAYRTVCNAKIAEILGGAAVRDNGQVFVLDKDQIEGLNQFLITAPPQNDFSFILGLLHAIARRGDQKLLPRSLTMALKNNWQDIVQEHQQNRNILAQLANNALEIQKREVCKVLARVKKNAGGLIDNADIDALISVINNSVDYDAFKNTLATPPHAAMVAKLQNWQAVITPEIFQYLKQQVIKQDLANQDKTIRKPVLEKQQAAFKTLQTDMKKFRTANGKISDELDRLSELDAVAWLAPEIGGIARRRAQEVKEQFELIATKCDDICAGLEGMRQELQTLLDSMPDDTDLQDRDKEWHNIIKGPVKTLREDIESELKNIDKMLVRYQEVHSNIYGNPLTNIQDANASAFGRDKTKKVGVLKVVQEAAQSAVDVQQPNYYGFVRTELQFGNRSKSIEKCIDDYEKSPQKDVTQVSGNARLNGDLFAGRGAPEPGEEVLYAKKAVEVVDTNTGNAVKVVSASGYSERRDQPRIKETSTGRQQLEQITLTVEKWPTTAVKNAQLTEHQTTELKEQKAKFAVDMAIRLLAGLGTLPTVDSPIVLRGSNLEELGMLWTVLVELGKTHAKYKFDESCIRVESMHFNPKSQKGLLGYSNDSYYKQYFSAPGNPLTEMKTEIRNFYETGFGHGLTEKALEARKDTSTLFKKLLQDGKSQEGIDAITHHRPK